MQHSEVIKVTNATASQTDAHVNAELEAKKAAWTAEQLALAERADVPRDELYSGAGTASTSVIAGASDTTFVHSRFSLQDVLEALTSWLDADSTDSAEAASVAWTALRQQLQFDVAQQQHLGAVTETSATFRPPRLTLIGGVDISFIPNTDDGIACLAVLRYPSLEVVKTYMHRCTLREPYLSSFLAFREIQPVCELFAAVRDELLDTHTMPQLLVVDGNGVHHPRRCGLATHLGVTLNIPTVGCSKKILQVDGITRESVEAALLHNVSSATDARVTTTTTTPPEPKVSHKKSGKATTKSAVPPLPYVLPLVGTMSPATLYGYAVHSPLNSVKKCIFVSPGHCVGFATATALVVTMLRHRIPEPIRAADLGSRAFIRDSLAASTATIHTSTTATAAVDVVSTASAEVVGMTSTSETI